MGEFKSPQEETVTFSRVSISNDLIFQSAATLFYFVFTCCGLLLILPQLTANESKAAIRPTNPRCWRESRGQQSCPNALTAGDHQLLINRLTHQMRFSNAGVRAFLPFRSKLFSSFFPLLHSDILCLAVLGRRCLNVCDEP